MSIVLFAVSSTLMGQNITELGIKGFHATFADDSKLLITTDNYTGLKSVDLKTKKENILSDARRAGKAIVIDNKIIFGDRTSATIMDLDGKKIKTVEKKRETSFRQVAFKENVSIAKKGSSDLVSANSINRLSAIELVYADGTSKIIKPLGSDVQYLQTEISPNGKFILIKQYGGNGYLMSNKGEMIIDLGYMEAPKWAGNDAVVFQVTKDNGDIITDSDIYKVGINSRVRTNLTVNFSKIAMDPSANSDGSKIVFNTDQGELYLITK